MLARAGYRWLETFFPAVRPLKYCAFNALTRRFGQRMDRDFRALGRMGPVELALDIGGNWGQSIEAFRRCSRPRQVISFEPIRELSLHLNKQYARDRGIAIRRCALSDAPGRMKLYVPRYRDFVFDGLASIIEREARGGLNPRQMLFYDPDKLQLEPQEVEVRTLDSFDLAPDLIKIDVQGAEERVVRGGLETFRRYRPVSIVEAPGSALVELFADLEMKPYYFDGRTFYKYNWQYKNAIFATGEQVERMRS